MTEDIGGGWQPPPWMKTDVSAWLVGEAMEKRRGMAEALAEKKPKRARPDLDADIESGRRQAETED